MEKFDVVIAGAGVAGSLAARDLARAGLRTALLDRRARARLGHDWWDSVDPTVFPEVGLPSPELPELMQPNAATTMYPPLESTTLTVGVGSPKIHVDRKRLARRLTGYAEEAGARVLDDTAALGPVLENGKVRGLVCKARGGNKQELRARITMDATGMSAALRAHLPENPNFPRHIPRTDMFVTYREIRENLSGERDSHLFFGKDKGLAWIKKEQDGLVDFFSGYINYPGRPSPKENLRHLMQRTRGVGSVVRGAHGGPIPVRHCFDAFVSDGFLLCGDAACQCNPMDGSGIASSLRATSHAAAVARAALENGRADTEALWPYNALYKRTQGAVFVALDVIQKFLVAETDGNIELLFRAGVINANSVYTEGDLTDPSFLETLAITFKLLRAPRLLLRLARAMKTAKALSTHYRNFPETYNAREFAAWQAHKTKLFGNILPS